GTPEAIAPAANTFKIKMNEWEGFSGALGRLISIDTSAATFRGPGGLMLTREQYYQAIAIPGAKAKAQGALEDGTIRATRCDVTD
ncbi:MAG: hypothetical protein SFX74_03005, partial [Fimbriimonadaceae bacterium]|nr:hypothetical protein [Fimbriimonadaceae bacterium]